MIGIIAIAVFFYLLWGIHRRLAPPRIKYTTRWSRARERWHREAQIQQAAEDAIALAELQEANDRATHRGLQ